MSALFGRPHSRPFSRPVSGLASRPGTRLGSRFGRWLGVWLLAAMTLQLVGCSGEQQELQAWMDQQRNEIKPSVEPLQPPKKFEPVPYQDAQLVDPFSTQKLSMAIKQEDRAPSSLLAAELSRRKEPLEAYPLDAMSMVGSLTKQGVPHALLRVDSLLYQVRAGDYLGQNFGRVTRITETEVSVREVVQDATGEWVERPASLQLQEQGGGGATR